jgi:oxygen-independent coproporphyrinogen-3 oxidase
MTRIIPILPAAPTAAANSDRLAFTSLPPLSLYVHVPWCVRKCPYCDFNSHEAKGTDGNIPEAEYVAALIADLESALPLIWGRPVVSVFFGGGTPSLLSGAAVDELLAAFRARLPLLPGAEITLEANPGTAEAERFAAYRAAGVNRLSLGIQSFDDRQLATLGRIHDAAAAHRAIAMAKQHFDNFNLDLMTALPGQDQAAALADLETALAYAPPHLSCYQLTIEANTRFAAAPPPNLPDDDSQADILDAVAARLKAAGYANYETSAYAQPGKQCQHNRNYWEFGDYLGIGAGAHGKITSHDKVLRQMRWKQPKEYLARVAAGQPVQSEESVAAADLPFEFMLNALRLTDGFDPRLFEQRTAQPLAAIVKELRRAADEGLLEVSAERIAPSARGRRLLNVLLERFL